MNNTPLSLALNRIEALITRPAESYSDPAERAAEFQRRFGGVDSPAYLDMMAEIEARIDRVPLYR